MSKLSQLLKTTAGTANPANSANPDIVREKISSISNFSIHGQAILQLTKPAAAAYQQ